MVASVLVVVARTALLSVPEIWAFGEEVGEVLYDVAIAYATAWLFQLLVIVLPARTQERRLAAILAPRIDALLITGYDLSNAVGLASARGTGRLPLEEGEVAGVFSTRDGIGEHVPGWATDWFGLFRHIARRNGAAQAALKPFYPRMSEELLELLEEEQRQMDIIVRLERLGSTSQFGYLGNFTAAVEAWLDAIQALREHRLNSLASIRRPPSPEAYANADDGAVRLSKVTAEMLAEELEAGVRIHPRLARPGEVPK